MSLYSLYEIIIVPPDILKVGSADYPHPYIVFELAQDGAYVMCMSTQSETFYRPGKDFKYEKTEDGFSTTNLDANGYVWNQDFFLSDKYRNKVQSKGSFSGDLLERFQAFLKSQGLLQS